MRPEKVWMVENVKNLAKNHSAWVMTDYTGLTAGALAQLRNRLKGVSASYVVVKNRLLEVALKDSMGVDVSSMSAGPTGVALSDDPVSLAKVLKAFAGEFEAFKVKGGLLKDRLLSKSEIAELAKIPSREALIAKMMGILKGPTTRLVWVLKGQLSSLAIVLAKIRDQKQQQMEEKQS
ncbi:MAG: 50S ribosomal protein L10 [Chlamydiae bacterium]|nr:50S ribosomal protein L10 [Chlamydiota bacterium]MBI3266652.1 50S ribosomal protein L10 [Chlamydiota bacterium]